MHLLFLALPHRLALVSVLLSMRGGAVGTDGGCEVALSTTCGAERANGSTACGLCAGRLQGMLRRAGSLETFRKPSCPTWPRDRANSCDGTMGIRPCETLGRWNVPLILDDLLFNLGILVLNTDNCEYALQQKYCNSQLWEGLHFLAMPSEAVIVAIRC